MDDKAVLRTVALFAALIGLLAIATASPSAPLTAGVASPKADSADPPASPVKLIFIHHSCGEYWLTDAGNDPRAGELGITLDSNNYFVSDTNYGWGPDDADLGYEQIGDHTDIGHWYNWFVGPHRDTYLNALYNESGNHSWYTRSLADPGGENQIVMFKSCFPNSDLQGNPGDPPTTGSNPLRGEPSWSDHHTVANAKGIYNDILAYFGSHPEKLFIVITAPPRTDATYAANARAFNTWLVEDWLDGYGGSNVAVFDFYNILTDPDNHHRFQGGTVEYITDQGGDTLYYPSGDDHPNAAGNGKATAEFVPLLNVYYNRWQSSSAAPSLTLTSPTGGETWAMSSTHQIRWTTAGTVTQVNLSYSSDGFGTSTDIATSTANVDSYAWTTPAITTTSMQVRVESAISPTTVYDESGEFTLCDAFEVYLPVVLRNNAPSSGELLQPSDLTYLGAFRLPDRAPGAPDAESWEYSGQALTYRPDGDPGGGGDGHPGALFGTGHDVSNYVSEVSIPAPGPSRNLGDLNFATPIQGFYDVRAGLFDGLEEMPRVGMQYLPAQAGQTSAKLHLAWGAHHHDEGSPSYTPSHAWCDLDLSAPNTQGAWWIDDDPMSLYRVNGYIFEIPQAWADTYVGGARLATGRYRDGGWSGMGPNLFAYGPWLDGNPPISGTLLTAHTLLAYSFAGGEHMIDDYQDSDEWEGGAWLTVGDRQAVVIVGTKGGGYWWYGYSSPAGDGMPCPFIPPPGSEDVVRCYNADGTDCEAGLLDCEGYDLASRGWWSSRFDAQIIFYNPADLVAVLAGTLEPHEPQPYAVLDIDEHLFLDPPADTLVDCGEGDQRKCRVSEMAYDRARGFLYILERFADESKPVVHVWQVQ